MIGPRTALSRAAAPAALLVALTGTALLAPFAAAQQEKPQAKAGRHALLVGVSKYPNLEERYQLRGPANDVLLMRDLLQKQFGFPAENITILAEHHGPDRLPTRAHIAREYARLAKVVQPGDQVVIFMAGHGSQQPEDPNSKDPEPDGLDEIFLPRDVGQWDGSTGKVVNAIIDDEIGAWLKAIRDKKASVWVIFDACHSGTMIRGVNERTRQANPSEALGIPKAALRAAQERAAKRDGGKVERTRGGAPVARPKNAIPGGVVAFYACQDTEVTVEQDLPANSADEKPYGLLTYTLAQVLTRAAESSTRPLTYKELAQRIQAHYSSVGRSSPTPLIEGKNEERDREILGDKVWPGRSNLRLVRKGSSLSLNAGAVHGVTAGTILAVYPPADARDADKMVGQVKVTRLKTLSAEVEPYEDRENPARGELPNGGRCEVVSVDYGSQRLRVALDPQDDAGKPLTAADRKRLAGELAKLGKQARALLEVVPDLAKADWLVRLHAGKVYLVPGAEWSRGAGAGKSPLFGPYPRKGKLVDDLKDSLTRIARAEALKKLAEAPGSALAGGSGGGRVKLQVELLRFRDETDRTGQPLTWESEGLVLHKGDRVGMRLRNDSPFPVDVTVLYIDSGYGITDWFPEGGEINRVPAGGRILVPAVNITPDTFGMENVVILAVKGSGQQPLDFTFLAQPTLDRERAKESVRGTPLGRLCQTAIFGEGNTRSIRRTAVEEYSLRLMPWRVVPTPRPAEPAKRP
jgi:hypothetical protein